MGDIADAAAHVPHVPAPLLPRSFVVAQLKNGRDQRTLVTSLFPHGVNTKMVCAEQDVLDQIPNWESEYPAKWRW